MTDPAPLSGEWFPCQATDADGTTYDTCRVVAEAGRTVVYWWDRELRSGRAVIESVGPPIPMHEGAQAWLIEVAGDEVASFRKQDGCGCSHPMKRWRPPAPRRAGT